MADTWDENRVKQYIIQSVEESLNLDYKAAASLAKSDEKKREITKDVSAMANSDGGIIIYGIAENPINKYLPDHIDPIDRNQIAKEWLGQMINNIRPKIDNVVIHPVPLSSAPNHVAYVVEIPQSNTAHQALDKKYYKRYNFESVAMEDYEIRDVMGRGQNPRIELNFEILITQTTAQTGNTINFRGIPISMSESSETHDVYKLSIEASNNGKVYAQYVNVFIYIPDVLLPPEDENNEDFRYGVVRPKEVRSDVLCWRHYDDNTTRDITGYNGVSRTYGPTRHVPILPGLSCQLEDVELRRDFEKVSLDGLFIEWEIFADNAPALENRIALSDIEIIDQRK